MEYRVSEEIKDVILNHQLHDSKRLRIEFEDSEGKIHAMKIKFQTDSTFIFKSKKHKTKNVIRGNEIFNINGHSIRLATQKLPENQVLVSTKENGQTKNSLYYVTGSDSVLFSVQTEKVDTIENATTSITKYRRNGKWTGNKMIINTFSKDLKQTRYYSLIDDNWELSQNQMEIILRSQTEFSRTKIVMTKGVSYLIPEKGLKLPYTINSERKSILHYDEKGVIEAVVIVKKDHENNFGRKKIEYLILYPSF
ncbi:MAG: hypothetical protein ACJASQ_003333 [Crocinitomicaceae bacterium]|jgi:hypothetical protein